MATLRGVCINLKVDTTQMRAALAKAEAALRAFELAIEELKATGIEIVESSEVANSN